MRIPLELSATPSTTPESPSKADAQAGLAPDQSCRAGDPKPRRRKQACLISKKCKGCSLRLPAMSNPARRPIGAEPPISSTRFPRSPRQWASRSGHTSSAARLPRRVPGRRINEVNRCRECSCPKGSGEKRFRMSPTFARPHCPAWAVCRAGSESNARRTRSTSWQVAVVHRWRCQAPHPSPIQPAQSRPNSTRHHS